MMINIVTGDGVRLGPLTCEKGGLTTCILYMLSRHEFTLFQAQISAYGHRGSLPVGHTILLKHYELAISQRARYRPEISPQKRALCLNIICGSSLIGGTSSLFSQRAQEIIDCVADRCSLYGCFLHSRVSYFFWQPSSCSSALSHALTFPCMPSPVSLLS